MGIPSTKTGSKRSPVRARYTALAATVVVATAAFGPRDAVAQDSDAAATNALLVIERTHNKYKALPELRGKAGEPATAGDAALERCIEALRTKNGRSAGSFDCLEAQGHYFTAQAFAPKLVAPAKALELMSVVAATYRSFEPLPPASAVKASTAEGTPLAAARTAAKPHMDRAVEMTSILKHRQRFEPALLDLERAIAGVDTRSSKPVITLLHTWVVLKSMADADPNAPAPRAAVAAYAIIARAFAEERTASRAK